MQIIDAHHHLWDIENHDYPHMKGPESIRIWGPNTKLRRNYLVEDFLADIRNQNVVKSVHVQANYDHGNPAGETRWLQSVADDTNSQGFPHAIVGWVDFTSPDCERQLEEHAEFPNFRGIRQIASRHPAEPLLDLTPVDLLNDETWLDNFGLLKKHDLSFDHQICAHQAEDTVRLANRHPDIPVILVHLAFPLERHYAGIEAWRANMRLLAKCPNISLKLSGLGMTDFLLVGGQHSDVHPRRYRDFWRRPLHVCVELPCRQRHERLRYVVRRVQVGRGRFLRIGEAETVLRQRGADIPDLNVRYHAR